MAAHSAGGPSRPDAAAATSRNHVAVAASYGLRRRCKTLGLLETRLRPSVDRALRERRRHVRQRGRWWPQRTLCHGAVVGTGLADRQLARQRAGRPWTSAGGAPDATTWSRARSHERRAHGPRPGKRAVARDIRLVEACSVHVTVSSTSPTARPGSRRTARRRLWLLSGRPEVSEVIRIHRCRPAPIRRRRPGSRSRASQAPARHPVGGAAVPTVDRLRDAEVSVRPPGGARRGDRSRGGRTRDTAALGQALNAIVAGRPAGVIKVVGPGGRIPQPTPPVTPVPGHYGSPLAAPAFAPTDPVDAGARRSPFLQARRRRSMTPTASLLCRLTGDTVHGVTMRVAGRVTSHAP